MGIIDCVQNNVCNVPGCDKSGQRRGLCHGHYHRYRAGDPAYAGYASDRVRRPPGLTHREVFERTEKLVTETGCIEWMGGRSTYNYGIIQSKVHGAIGAHRVALSIKLGHPIPDNVHALHTCDNPPCVNPDHLFAGTDQDNVADMIAKGRNIYGERVKTRKLTENQVREIIARHSTGTIGQRRLAREYGVSASAIQKITEGKLWGYLPRPEYERTDCVVRRYTLARSG